MTIFLSMDDTDNLASRGTGRLARAVAEALSDRWPVSGVTRHQLYVHEDIPFTSHNSCAVIHLEAGGAAAAGEIFRIAEEMMVADFIEGSDPGVAVADLRQVTPALFAFGKDAKCRVLTRDHARLLARNLAITLKGLGGTEDGVIGAMAGLGLAATRNDGRYLMKGTIRTLLGPSTVADLVEAGIDQVCTLDGRSVSDGLVMIPEGKSAKPCPVNGRAILFVEERDGLFTAVKRD
jgi:hypothetical protein